MKKMRLISIIMVAALVFTSLPIMAMPVAADGAKTLAVDDVVNFATDKSTGWTGAAYTDESYVQAKVRGTEWGLNKITLYNPSDASACIAEAGKYYQLIVWMRQTANGENNANLSQPFGMRFYKSFPAKAYTNATFTADWSEMKSPVYQIDTSMTCQIWVTPRNNQTFFADWDIRGMKVIEVDSTGAPVLTEGAENVIYAWGAYSSSADRWSKIVASTGTQTLLEDMDKGLYADITAPVAYCVPDKEITLLPGEYRLKGTFNTDADSVSLFANMGTLPMIVAATGGASADLTTTATEIEYTVTVTEETALSDISFTWIVPEGSAATKVRFDNLTLTCTELTQGDSRTGGYIGIFMMLLLKRRAASATPSTPDVEEDTTVVEEGDNLLANAIADVETDKWSVNNQTLEAKTEGDNKYLAFSGITVNHTGFSYNSGVTVEAGTYKLTGKIRTANSGEKSQQRIYVNGTQLGSIKIENNWADFEYDVEITEAAELVFKVNGDANKTFIEDYDIMDLALVPAN